jgi:DNA-directed RNA polymerase subunit RPC12/RpoP
MITEKGKCMTCGSSLSPMEAEAGKECGWCKHKRDLAQMAAKRIAAEHSFFAAPTTPKRKHDAAAFIR